MAPTFFFQICGPLIDEGQLHQIVDELKHVIKESLNRKRKLTERTKSEDFDDEEAKVLADEEAQEDLIIARVCFILRIKFRFTLQTFFFMQSFYLGSFYCYFRISQQCLYQVGTTLKTLIRTFKAAFVPFLDELLSYLIPMWVSLGHDNRCHSNALV